MDSSKILSSVAVGSILGVIAVLVSWLLGGESSPIYEFFLQNVTIPNIWLLLNFPAYMVLALSGAGSFAAGLFMIFLQWFIIGFFGSFAARRAVRRSDPI